MATKKQIKKLARLYVISKIHYAEPTKNFADSDLTELEISQLSIELDKIKKKLIKKGDKFHNNYAEQVKIVCGG